MNIRFSTTFLFLAFSFINFSLSAQDSLVTFEDGSVLLEDFEADGLEILPSRWYDRDANYRLLEYNKTVKDTYKYRVLKEDGNKFLRYEGQKAMHINLPLANRDNLNIHETPVLSWSWRVFDIPEGANEDFGKNDVAASIYVVFNFGRVLFKKVPKSIRYTWSSTLPVGTELSKFYGNQKIVVVASGEDWLGEWITFERNIVEDYERLYGDEAPVTPLAILILSDGDETHNNILADYDDIFLLPLK
ncbi:MAG: DUF3047 domain-containing protein [Balneolaceae bacterium]